MFQTGSFTYIWLLSETHSVLKKQAEVREEGADACGGRHCWPCFCAVSLQGQLVLRPMINICLAADDIQYLAWNARHLLVLKYGTAT